jgi:acetyl esterase
VTLDPELEPIVALLSAAAEATPLAAKSVDDVRDGLAALPGLLGEPDEVAAVETHRAPGPAGPVPVRCYRPAAAETPGGALVYLHGGGFVIGDLDTHDHLCRTLANDAGLVVVSVDYRRAPEAPAPAALEDAWASVQWLGEHASELGIDPRRLAVGGDSAGGNLAAVVARRFRDLVREGDDPGWAVRFQMLVYPVTDLRAGADWPSMERNGSGYVLTAEMMAWFRHHYLGDRDGTDPDVSPLAATDLSDLPGAYVLVAEYDPLHDEGKAYAEAMASAGVAVELEEVAGAVHLFFQLGPVAGIARRAVRRSAQAVRRALDA